MPVGLVFWTEPLRAQNVAVMPVWFAPFEVEQVSHEGHTITSCCSGGRAARWAPGNPGEALAPAGTAASAKAMRRSRPRQDEPPYLVKLALTYGLNVVVPPHRSARRVGITAHMGEGCAAGCRGLPAGAGWARREGRCQPVQAATAAGYDAVHEVVREPFQR